MMRLRWIVGVWVVSALGACDSFEPASAPAFAVAAHGSGGEQSIAEHAEGHTHHDGDDDDHDGHDEGDHDHHHHHPHVVLTPEIRHAAARVLILQSTHTDRTTEVVGVVDVHADSGDQDEALDELRAVALSMGADAVLGVEFHHGEHHDEPTHLSGLAVRFLSGVPYVGH